MALDAENGSQKDAAAAVKARLRATMAARLRAVSPEDRARASARASHNLEALLRAHLPPGAPIALYAPTPLELSALPAARALAADHPLAFPRMEGDRLTFRLAGPDELRPGEGRIPEPPAEAPEVIPAAVVVPGRAFDRRGHRLGRGRGHYDRALAALPAGTLLVGYAFAAQLVEPLPDEAHDRPVGWIVTDQDGPIACTASAEAGPSSGEPPPRSTI